MKRDRKYQIDFTGLRFFLRSTEGRITRKELVEEIRRFLDESGAEITGTIRVEFRMTRRPSGADGKPIMGCHESWPSRISVFIRAHDGRGFGEIGDTLGHELDHELWKWQGKVADYSLPYRKRPQEIRAWATGAEWKKKWESR